MTRSVCKWNSYRGKRYSFKKVKCLKETFKLWDKNDPLSTVLAMPSSLLLLWVLIPLQIYCRTWLHGWRAEIMPILFTLRSTAPNTSLAYSGSICWINKRRGKDFFCPQNVSNICCQTIQHLSLHYTLSFLRSEANTQSICFCQIEWTLYIPAREI